MIHTHKREDLVLRTAQIHLVFDKTCYQRGIKKDIFSQCSLSELIHFFN